MTDHAGLYAGFAVIILLSLGQLSLGIQTRWYGSSLLAIGLLVGLYWFYILKTEIHSFTAFVIYTIGLISMSIGMAFSITIEQNSHLLLKKIPPWRFLFGLPIKKEDLPSPPDRNYDRNRAIQEIIGFSAISIILCFIRIYYLGIAMITASVIALGIVIFYPSKTTA
jgi:hypothetical protein